MPFSELGFSHFGRHSNTICETLTAQVFISLPVGLYSFYKTLSSKHLALTAYPFPS
jgi:hypothetical protein